MTAPNVFPFKWRAEGCVETLGWKTDVLEADDASEQRRKLRTVPARDFTFGCALTGEQIGALQSLAYGKGYTQFAFPLWTDAATLGTATTAGATFIPVATAYRSFSTGRYACLWTDWQQREGVGPITAVASSGITLSTAGKPVAAYSTAARVMPALLGKLPEPVGRQDVSAGHVEGTLHFRADDNYAVTASTYATLYQTVGVLATVPKAVEPLDNSVTWPQTILDNEIGKVAHDVRSDFGANERIFRWRLSGRAAIWAFRQWLHAVTGRLGTFYAPSFTKDIRLIGTLTSAATVATISNIKYADYVDAHTNMRDVAFVKTDGTMLLRRISAASTSSATQETITLDSALGAAYTAASFTCISFLQKYRLDADRIEMHWASDTIMDVAAPMKVVP